MKDADLGKTDVMGWLGIHLLRRFLVGGGVEEVEERMWKSFRGPRKANG